MTYSPKIVLRTPFLHPADVPRFVEECLRDQVCLIAIIGERCADAEDLIDELILADGSDESRFITTTLHPDESLDDVLNFVRCWSEAEGQGQQVQL